MRLRLCSLAGIVIAGMYPGTLVDIRPIVGVPDAAFTARYGFPGITEARYFTCPPRIRVNPHKPEGICWMLVGGGPASVTYNGVTTIVTVP